MKDLGIVDSGDALNKGIGAMDAARVKAFYDAMATAGVIKAAEVDLTKVYTTQFVNKGIGLDIRKTLVK
jgi:NitT/TauT family transport system substrate-binding protein